MTTKKYIVAVSGGIDSVVLLHKLVAQNSNPNSPNVFVVAHFDHGIREDSKDDALFVKALAQTYDLEFVCERAELGHGASEAEAREARYVFLYKVMQAYGAEAIITAHHQDDVIETILVNVLRGTSPRGLIGYSRQNIVRPLLDKPKSWILDYATKNNLHWHEDSTNADIEYLRNYIRLKLIPKLEYEHVNKLLEYRKYVSEAYQEIDMLIKSLIVQITNKGELQRASFVTLPYVVQKELVATLFRIRGIAFDAPMVEKTVIAIKTMLPQKQLQIGQGFILQARKHTLAIVKNHLAPCIMTLYESKEVKKGPEKGR